MEGRCKERRVTGGMSEPRKSVIAESQHPDRGRGVRSECSLLPTTTSGASNSNISSNIHRSSSLAPSVHGVLDSDPIQWTSALNKTKSLITASVDSATVPTPIGTDLSACRRKPQSFSWTHPPMCSGFIGHTSTSTPAPLRAAPAHRESYKFARHLVGIYAPPCRFPALLRRTHILLPYVSQRVPHTPARAQGDLERPPHAHPSQEALSFMHMPTPPPFPSPTRRGRGPFGRTVPPSPPTRPLPLSSPSATATRIKRFPQHEHRDAAHEHAPEAQAQDYKDYDARLLQHALHTVILHVELADVGDLDGIPQEWHFGCFVFSRDMHSRFREVSFPLIRVLDTPRLPRSLTGWTWDECTDYINTGSIPPCTTTRATVVLQLFVVVM
ncbi:hypothetical protein B0H13DRAFT_1913414 [Mycena leptocephala]|nr:hypothetical protein B0H13DRAFT_1913414 [Mycena leptocephala]